eukprot:364650-Chlamydomonas_euryale.AAC.1
MTSCVPACPVPVTRSPAIRVPSLPPSLPPRPPNACTAFFMRTPAETVHRSRYRLLSLALSVLTHARRAVPSCLIADVGRGAHWRRPGG